MKAGDKRRRQVLPWRPPGETARSIMLLRTGCIDRASIASFPFHHNDYRHDQQGFFQDRARAASSRRKKRLDFPGLIKFFKGRFQVPFEE
jgi:hypothetical protein